DFDLQGAHHAQEPLSAEPLARLIEYLPLRIARCCCPRGTLPQCCLSTLGSSMRARAGRCYPTEIAEQTQSVWFLLLAYPKNGRRMLLKWQACIVGSNAR